MIQAAAAAFSYSYQPRAFSPSLSCRKEKAMSGGRYYTNYVIYADGKDVGGILGELALADTICDTDTSIRRTKENRDRFRISIQNDGYTDLQELAGEYPSMVATAVNCSYDGCGGYASISEAFADGKRIYRHCLASDVSSEDGDENIVEGSLEGYPELEGFDPKPGEESYEKECRSDVPF